MGTPARLNWGRARVKVPILQTATLASSLKGKPFRALPFQVKLDTVLELNCARNCRPDQANPLHARTSTAKDSIQDDRVYISSQPGLRSSGNASIAQFTLPERRMSLVRPTSVHNAG